jgi:hypothetical protein
MCTYTLNAEDKKNQKVFNDYLAGKPTNTCGAVLKGFIWHYRGRCYPSLSPLSSPAEVDDYFGTDTKQGVVE